jgi:hypothetical protein
MDLTRSQFLRLCAGAGLGALGLSALPACSDSEGQDPSPGNPDASRPVDASIDGATADGATADAPPVGSCPQPEVAISFNHDHVMVVSALDIATGIEKEYDIQGTSDHPHTVTITAPMFAMLRQNTTVMAVSSVDDGHPHTVTIRCA